MMTNCSKDTYISRWPAAQKKEREKLVKEESRKSRYSYNYSYYSYTILYLSFFLLLSGVGYLHRLNSSPLLIM